MKNLKIALAAAMAMTVSTVTFASTPNGVPFTPTSSSSLNSLVVNAGIGSDAESGGGVFVGLKSDGNSSITAMSSGAAGSSTTIGFGRTLTAGGDIAASVTGPVLPVTGDLGATVGGGSASGITSTTSATHTDSAGITTQAARGTDVKFTGEAGSYSIADAYNEINIDYKSIERSTSTGFEFNPPGQR